MLMRALIFGWVGGFKSEPWPVLGSGVCKSSELNDSGSGISTDVLGPSSDSRFGGQGVSLRGQLSGSLRSEIRT